MVVMALGLGACRDGRTGARCANDAECESGLCAAVGERGPICAERCELIACGPEAQCAATDEGAICVSRRLADCQPCVVDGDCNQGGLEGYACASYGAAGSFCASACDGTTPCAPGFRCDAGRCRRDGACECNAWGIALGAETECVAVDDERGGVCAGLRGCGSGGLAPCVPSATCAPARHSKSTRYDESAIAPEFAGGSPPPMSPR